MANTHFIVEALASAANGAEAEPRRVALHVEVEGSAPIRSEAELLRATRAIAGEEIERLVGTRALGEFRVAQTMAFDKEGEPRTSSDWPGTYVWRVVVA